MTFEYWLTRMPWDKVVLMGIALVIVTLGVKTLLDLKNNNDR